MSRLKTKTITPVPRKYIRRSDDQLIADLKSEIERIRVRAATKAVRKDPALRHISRAIKAIDAATAESGDSAVRTALQEARTTLGACLELNGAIVPKGRQIGSGVDPEALYDYVRGNPGRRSEEIAAALGAESKSLRTPMKRLIADRKVRTAGARRGMQYFPA